MDEVKVKGQKTGKGWAIYNADTCEAIKGIPDNSMHYSIFSPPFASLYTYSASDRDMGNCKTHDGFYTHFKFLVSELYRVMMPGRCLSFHCMNLPTSKQNHGYIGIRDFRGELIRLFCEAGFIHHSEVCIWKDPVLAMQRTKALGLLYKQLRKDSCMSRQGIPDYLITMRKPGDNPEPVTHTFESHTVEEWQRLASPVWATKEPAQTRPILEWEHRNQEFSEFYNATKATSNKGDVFKFNLEHDEDGINAGDTLQSMAEENDERHICPLQLPVIERGIRLWTNPGDVVLTPFCGIGSEVYTAVKMGRKGIGFELKTAYYNQSLKNMATLETEMDEGVLF